ncbi:MAG: prepilin-type N-terminal cleavage/methylation domain-containing protein [Candidatus Eremiobacteraeota bacterium]|nr:prepilin-type N-terminal cleavage/methylation domain-containing protein [Candidatus Eremiobacteraeota bacterium]
MRRGFSLAELILCLGILAISLVFLTSFFISLYRATDKSGNTAIGTRAAETVINQQLHDIYKGSHPTLTKSSFFAADAAPGLSGSLQLGQTEFQYQMDYSTVQSSSGGSLGASLAGNRVKMVTVRCWWWGANAGSQRAGQGRLSVELHRLVNENDEF